MDQSVYSTPEFEDAVKKVITDNPEIIVDIFRKTVDEDLLDTEFDYS